VNHLHLHGLCTEGLSTPDLSIERASRTNIAANESVTLSITDNYPVKTLIFSSPKNKCLHCLAEHVSHVVDYLIANNVRHNVLFSKTSRDVVVYVVPRKPQVPYSADRLGMGVAVMEIVGIAICRDDETFDEMTFESFTTHLVNCVALTTAEVNPIIEHALKRFS
jgi:hypothetical protein